MMISIVILNWNTSDMLLRLEKTIDDNTTCDYDISILDNGSIQSEYEKIKDRTFIREEVNLGFAAGNNVVAKAIMLRDNGHVIFINSDIIIEEHGWNEKFTNLLDRDNVAIVGCAYHPLVWDKNGNFHIQPIPNEAVESQSVQGAFFGISNKCFVEQMKEGFIFDEAFKYAHYEETDLCFRMRKKGYKIYWVPVKHIHDHNNSATKKNGYKLNDEIQNANDFKANSNRNKQLFIERHIDIL